MLIPSKAQSTFEVDGIWYKIIKEADEANTYGLVHVCPKPYGQYEGKVVIPNAVANGDDEYADIYKVVGIASKTFANTENLESVTLSVSIETIGEDAFYNSSLRSIKIPYGNLKSIPEKVFYCSRLESIHLPKSVKEIGVRAFAGNNYLKSVITDGVTQLGNGAFYSCAVETVKLPESLVTIGSNAFAHCKHLNKINFPANLKSIGCQAFQGCEKLLCILLPKNIKKIGGLAFYQCAELEAVYLKNTIPPTITSTEDYRKAPFDYSKILKIYVPKGSLDEYKKSEEWIKYADKLIEYDYSQGNPDTDDYKRTQLQMIDKNVTTCYIPEGIEDISERAFYNRTELTSVYIPSTVKAIRSSAFWKCSKLSEINLPESIEIIENGAFSDCSSIKKIDIPAGVKIVDQYLFYGCSSLQEVTLPDTIEKICKSSFKNCSSLITITIPHSVKLIEAETFSGCTNLQTINIYRATEVDPTALSNCNAQISYLD